MKTKRDLKKKEVSNTFITMSTISDKLSTDQNYFSMPTAPKPTKLCGYFGVHKIAIFGISFNAIFLFAFYVYGLIRLIQKTPKNYVEFIVICSILITMILTFSLMFIMAVFRARPKFLLPYMVLNTILFFAYAGAVIGSTITVPDEIREEVNGQDRSYKIVDIILLRVALLVFGAFEIFFIYSYIWTYIDVRRLYLFNRR
ncbi:MARVEL domain-containing protein [Caenorhabditis elegans]|uniref:MARVEL domain-containing protein n=3 Tax=Caenorhabditis elegans TaxID=6239 RepID=Q17875_CAEEL|nr:MARVEL domain-containing protein [Caenorhabditis elegans]CAA90975.3 MARVEL domain-containing protein [Caenorhabditis elegans]|eukprot:NP_001255350.1 Uncharacterized protein CELE_C09G9.5 [Caenorhabditis elegans]